MKFNERGNGMNEQYTGERLGEKENAMANRWFMNPMVRKLNKVKDVNAEHCATYGGVARKTIWFLIMTVAGLVVYFCMHTMMPMEMDIELGSGTTNIVELLGLLISAVFAIVTPLIAFLIRPVIPVFGSLYCAATGYMVGFLGNTYGGEYKNIVWLALGITIILVLTMAVIYQTGMVKIGHKFRTVITCLFAASILSSLALFIMSFFPATQPLVAYVRDNMVLGIISSVIFVIIACLMLLTDFDSIKHTVENKLSKKYEWLAAFSLAYTVIWLYLKVLDLLVRAQGKSK